MSGDPVLDPEQVRQLEESLGVEELAAMLDDLLVTVARRLEALQAADREGDLVAWGALVHGLKGVCGLVGAGAMVQACVRADPRHRLVPGDERARHQQDLQETWDATREAIARLRVRLRGHGDGP